MKWLFPFGPLLNSLFDKLVPERFKTEGALTILAIFNVLFTLLLYGFVIACVVAILIN